MGPRRVCVNENSTRKTDYASFETIGKTLRTFQGSKTDYSRLDEIRSALSKRGPVRVALLDYRMGDTEYLVEIDTVLVGDGRGRVSHFVQIR